MSRSLDTPAALAELVEYHDFRHREDPFMSTPWDQRIGLYPWWAIRHMQPEEMQNAGWSCGVVARVLSANTRGWPSSCKHSASDPWACTLAYSL